MLVKMPNSWRGITHPLVNVHSVTVIKIDIYVTINIHNYEMMIWWRSVTIRSFLTIIIKSLFNSPYGEIVKNTALLAG